NMPSLYIKDFGDTSLIAFPYAIFLLYAKIKTLLRLCAFPYSAALMTRHSTSYPNSLRVESMTAKSLPRCLEGDFNRRSTFSNSTYFGTVFCMNRVICQNRTPFLPEIPSSPFSDLATE